MAVSKIAHLRYQTFCLGLLGLLRSFAVSFCLCTMDTTHSREILLPRILLSVLLFFSILINFTNFYSTKCKPFFYFNIFWHFTYILFWKFLACSFQMFDWLKTPVLLYFKKKNCIWYFESSSCFTKFFTESWLLVTNIVYTSCHGIYQFFALFWFF